MRKCFVCGNTIPDIERNAQDILDECPIIGISLAKLLSEIVDKTVPDEELHSKEVCKICHKNCIKYDTAKKTLNQLKTDILTKFKNGLPKFGLSYGSYPKKPPPNIGKKLVVSASKLQPLPPDYVINVAKLPTSLSPQKMNLPKIMNIASSPSINIKVTAGSSLLTHSTKTTTSPQKPTTTDKSIDNNIATLSSILNSQSTMSTSNSMLSFNVNSLPKDFLSSAVLTKIDEGNIKKDCENDDDLNNDEQPMEIDEDCTLVAENESSFDENEQKSPEKSQYFDVSLLPLAEGSTNDTILGKLQILDQADGEDDDDEGEGETIVMTGENGSILRIMSGQKLVYENGEITLASDDENSNQDDNNDGHDSNDESQIELQVSGDEETANAIIAAAQEQGGAFIKVESGEMFRVKSVQSKTAGPNDDSQVLNMVSIDGDVFKCLLCENGDKDADPLSISKFVVTDAERMMHHLKSEHDARIYICSICKKVMRKRIEYSAHIEEHSAKISKCVTNNDKHKTHECPQCKKKYNSRTLLQEHMNVHNGTRPYSCSVCKKSFASKYTHQAHLKTHLARPRPYKCTQCPKSFFTQQNLTQHEKTHLGIKDFVCNVCGKAFGTQHNLEVHGVVHSGTKPYVCGVCGKAFARRAEVKDHMRIHTGERPFSCDICGATFTQRSNLYSHKRATHLDDKRYQCSECPKKFKRRRLLDYHIKASHTGERPLECGVCHATFVYPEHYKKHARIHSGEKPYVCEVCGKSFNSRDNRNTHRFVHSDKKPYECLVCGAGYMRKQLLYAHMNTSGHLAESIVVNQPRVQKAKGKKGEAETSKENSDQLDTIIEQPNELQLSALESKPDVSTENEATTKLFVTGDKKIILQDGKINLVQDAVDPTLLTFIQNLDSSGKADEVEHVQMVTSDENGGIRLVELHINANPATWTLNQE